MPFGAALVVIDYPLIPTVRMAGIVAACRRAVTYVHRHGSEHGLDPTAYSLPVLRRRTFGRRIDGSDMTHMAGLPDDVIKGGAAVSGLFDFRPVAASFRNDSLRITPEEVERFSPLLRRPEIRSRRSSPSAATRWRVPSAIRGFRAVGAVGGCASRAYRGRRNQPHHLVPDHWQTPTRRSTAPSGGRSAPDPVVLHVARTPALPALPARMRQAC